MTNWIIAICAFFVCFGIDIIVQIVDKFVNWKERREKYRHLIFRRNLQKLSIIAKRFLERHPYLKEIEDYTGKKIDTGIEAKELHELNKKINHT